MDYVSGKVTMLVGEATSRANETRRKWAQQKRDKQQQQQSTSIEYIDEDEQRPKQTTSRMFNNTTTSNPFGGDSYAFGPPPPPIGFRLPPVAETSDDVAQPKPQDLQDLKQPQQPQLGDSDESLYQGDAWARLWFQRVMILCLLRLLLFVRKVYEDMQATKVYQLTGQTGHFLIAFATLFLPTIVFTIYRVARYLQVTLPSLRHEQQQQQQHGQHQEGLPKRPARKRSNNATDEDESQLTRALMSSPTLSAANESSLTPQNVAAAAIEEPSDGLVTARETPTLPLEEFHDSRETNDEPTTTTTTGDDKVIVEKKRAIQQVSAPNSPTTTTTPEPNVAQTQRKLESVNVDKLLATPDARNTTRLVTGASEQLLHGVLFIFWQLKRQVDVLAYLVERACLWRKPAEMEKEQLGRLRTGADGLEWFQDFYAAFLAILAQVYTLGLHWSAGGGGGADITKLSAAQVNAATGALSTDPKTSNDLTISHTGRAISQLLGNSQLNGKDVLIMSELLVSTAVVVSLLIAVRRRDDGPLTLGLSMLGWGSLFAARIIIISLSFVHLGWHLMLPLVVLHVLLITAWIYRIALASHNDAPSERQDEAKWDEETRISNQQQQQAALELEEQSKTTTTTKQASNASSNSSTTSNWSLIEHLVLIAQILTLFAIPSLFYWPIMFNLKLHFRPFKYLVLILIENFLLIPIIWFNLTQAAATPGQLYLLGTVGGFSILGFIFISLYISCKPSLTEFFARADELFNEQDKSGVYYEFCSRVFKMPDLSKQTFRRLMNQSEVVIEEEEEVIQD